MEICGLTSVDVQCLANESILAALPSDYAVFVAARSVWTLLAIWKLRQIFGAPQHGIASD